jgi:hypothetical protein
MNKTRNPNATCGTCPYWGLIDGDVGECRQGTPGVYVFPEDNENGEDYVIWICTPSNKWCGEHPDFWETETAERLYGSEAMRHAKEAQCVPPINTLTAAADAMEESERLRAVIARLCEALDEARTDLAKRDAVIAGLVNAKTFVDMQAALGAAKEIVK